MKSLSSSVWLLYSLCVTAILAYPTDLIFNDTAVQYLRPAFQTCVLPSNTDWWPRGVPPAEETASDCENALFQMVDRQKTYGQDTGKFVYQGTNSYAIFLGEAHGIPVRFALPALFTHESCTIAVMTMKMWEPFGKIYRFPQLPSVFDHDWSAYDEAMWMEVTSIAGEIRSTCNGGMGYAIFGPHKGLGVALWRTGNLWNRAVEGYASGKFNSTVETDEASDVVAVTK